MSTILKALEKVEEDQRLGRTPWAEEVDGSTPQEAPKEPESPPDQWRPSRGSIAGAVAVAFTLGLVWVWTPRQTEQEPALTEPVEASSADRVAVPGDGHQATPVVSSPPPVTQPASVTPFPSPAARAEAPAQEPPPLAVASEIQPMVDEPEHREVSDPPIVNSVQMESIPPAPSRTPRPAASPSVASAPPPARPKPRPPRVASIPPPPVVHVAGTVWHPDPDRRRASVEVQGFSEPLDLKEGDAVGVLVVAEIQPSAVVFLHGSRRLRRSVGR